MALDRKNDTKTNWKSCDNCNHQIVCKTYLLFPVIYKIENEITYSEDKASKFEKELRCLIGRYCQEFVECRMLNYFIER